MKELVELVKDDWKKIPLNFRYFIYAGIFFIFMSWLGDHWSDQQQYHVPWPFQNNEAAFQIGFYVIVVFFSLLLIKQISLWRKIARLRWKYPLKDIDKKFHIVVLRPNPGWVFLLDEERKCRVHIKTEATAQDLRFVGEWTVLDVDKDAPPGTELTLRSGKTVKLGDYRIDPYGLISR